MKNSFQCLAFSFSETLVTSFLLSVLTSCVCMASIQCMHVFGSFGRILQQKAEYLNADKMLRKEFGKVRIPMWSCDFHVWHDGKRIYFSSYGQSESCCVVEMKKNASVLNVETFFSESGFPKGVKIIYEICGNEYCTSCLFAGMDVYYEIS